MVEAARLVGDKALFEEKNPVIVSGSYVEADAALEVVKPVIECKSEHFRDGKYYYPDYGDARCDSLFRPIA